MQEELDFVLQRVDSRLLAKLWLFYRNYFSNDEGCLNFIFRAVRQEPIYSQADRKAQFLHALDEENYIDPDDRLFIPRRMLNCVGRLVSAARDMERIRKGQDIFKIVYLVTCTESLYMLKLGNRKTSKSSMLSDFFERYTTDEDKAYIREHFAHGSRGLYPDEDGFYQFISVLKEYRNGAAHEGQYWETCFNNFDSQTPLWIDVNIRLNDEPKPSRHTFETTISYRKFEEIFVRACISFIEDYIAHQN